MSVSLPPNPRAIASYWNQFLRSLPAGNVRPARYYEAFHFGSSAESADELATLVRNGIKTATGSLQWADEAGGKPLPQKGDLSIVTDGAGNPVCVIETTEIRIISFSEADASLAWDGGEGDRSLATWRSIYWEYIEAECRRIGRVPTPQTPLVAERFRVIFDMPPEVC